MATVHPSSSWSSSTTKRRYRLTVEYDGTEFAGFQIQGKGERTVQGALEEAVSRLARTPTRIHGAGRTDAGVHASGQVVHLDAAWSLPIERLADVLNANLPPDVSIRTASEAESGFHSRFDATSRTYRYAILNRPTRSALMGRFALHERGLLNLEQMQAAATTLLGTHDFAAFGQPDEAGRSTVRFMERITVRKWKDAVLITVRGNAFLRSQVRAMVGTLLQVGRSKLGPEEVRQILESRSRAQCPGLAPAKGLCLVRVDYDGTRIEATGQLGQRIEENEDLFGKAE